MTVAGATTANCSVQRQKCLTYCRRSSTTRRTGPLNSSTCSGSRATPYWRPSRLRRPRRSIQACSLPPNLDLALFLVAPDERRAKVRQEIKRPTFAYREKALPKVLRKPLTTCARFSNNGEPWTTSFAPPVGTFSPASPLPVLACSLPVALSPLRTPGRV